MVSFLAPPTAVDGVTLQQSGAGVVSIKAGGVGATELAAGVVRNKGHGRAGTVGAVRTTAITAGLTRYISPLHDGTADAAEANMQDQWAEAATIRAARIYVTANASTAAGSATLRVNGSSVNMPTIAIGAGVTGVFELAGNLPVAIAAGDLVTVQVIAGTGGNLTIAACELESDAT